MIRKIVMGAALGLVPVSAPAAPGVAEKVYGATIEGGVTELESRYGRLTGGPDDGADALSLELAHGFSDKFYAALVAKFERDPAGPRRLAEVAIEGIAPIARIDALGLDIALYGEYAAVRGGRDALEAKLLLEHRKGSFDGRLNLVGGRDLASRAVTGFEYAASADWAIADAFRLGAAAFGDIGDSNRLFRKGEHYAGPVAKFEVEPLGEGSEIEVEAGYLFPIGGQANANNNGQARLLLEWETRF
ncbi:MAG: hypothetical protein H0X36_00975 [Sphingomonadaceae bacterium]|nr:hypothetical protein [Sphingomonadaceae bacterium]